MNVRSETRRLAEAYALKTRWALLAAALLLAGGQALNPIVMGLLIGSIVVSLMAHRQVKSQAIFEATGHRLVIGLRYFDAAVVSAASALPALSGHNLWGLTIPVILAHAIATRSIRGIALISGAMALIHGGVAFAFNSIGLATYMTLAAIAGGAALAVVLAWFQTRDETLSARNGRLQTVLACGSALGSNTNLRQTILDTLRSAVLETGSTAGYVMLVGEESKELLITEAAFSEHGDFEFPTEMVVGEGLSGYVVKMGQPIAMSADDESGHEFDGVTVGVRSAVSVPLVTRGFGGGAQANAEQVLGVMTLLDTAETHSYTSEDLDLLQALSALLAVAVSNARMEERRRSTFLRTLESLATALEARDEYTRGHSQRVCEVSLMVGEKMGLGPEALEELRVGTILHDIGKIGVPDAILNKRARLTDEEFMVMRQHPVIGYEICKPLMLSEGVLMIIRNHHEKLDGTGYPDGLKGGELPLSLRIVCAADAFDAMSSRRPYRGVMDPMHVQAELSKGAGTQFDPVVVETLRELLPTDRMFQLYRSFWEPQEESAA